MSDGFVTRPPASTKKIHSRDEFELCYLRHQYFRRANYNPTEAEMEPYMWVIRNLSKNTYYTYQTLFNMAGMDLDDIVNIGRVHLTSYLGSFSIKSDEAKLDRFRSLFFDNNGYPAGTNEINNKDKADLTSFMKQRYEDLVRVCRQKCRNIKGYSVEEYFAYKGPSRPPKILRKLVENHEIYGFRKIDQGSFKTIKKKAKPNSDIFQYDGLWYVAVMTSRKNLEMEDFTGADVSPYDNVHNMSPEEIIISRRSESEWEERKNQFEGYSKEMKVNKIKSFIRKNNKNKYMASEIATARKLLKSLQE